MNGIRSISKGTLDRIILSFRKKNREIELALKDKFKKRTKSEGLWGKIPEKRRDFLKKYGLGFLAVSLMIYLTHQDWSKQMSINQMLQLISESQIKEIEVYKMKGNEEYFVIKFSFEGEQYSVKTKELQNFQEMITKYKPERMAKIKIKVMTKKTWDQLMKEYIRNYVHIFLPLLFPILLFRSKLGNFFKSTIIGETDSIAKPNVLFKDIAGLGDAKIQVSELVDFLKNPQKYKKIGAKVPKGALLAGPPGTGKTMLAKACAGEANVPFFSMSGSQFVELFAGMGARRVRQLFANAKQQTPSIIFIDEIDAIGRKREDKFGSSNDERANTLNQLLVEMDGFGTQDDIIVIAATNRKEMLDNALTRPGRFDRIVEIQLPDIQGRKQILQIYLKKLALSQSQNIQGYSKRLSTLTFGFSGADLANLCNEAAIMAVRKGRSQIVMDDFEMASDRVLAGMETNAALSKIQRRKVAYHESGHAVTAWFLEGASPLLKITIIPRSKGALGFAQYLPNQSSLATTQDLQDQLCVILGGRTAEQIFFGQVTNGASDDLQKARQLCHAIVVTYGMSKTHVNYAPVQTDGQNIYSQSTATQIDKEMMNVIRRNTQRTRQILLKYKQKVEALAEAVLEKESLDHKEIRYILGERPFAAKENYRQFLEQVNNRSAFDEKMI